MNPASRQELAYIPRTSRGDDGTTSPVRSSTGGQEIGWSTHAPLWAYCRELCGPEDCDEAIAAVLKELEDAPLTISEDELLLITRTTAARFAVSDTNGSSATHPTRACATTPLRLAAWANGLLLADEQRELAEHLDGCLNCQAIKIRMERAERGFATLSGGAVALESPFPGSVERPGFGRLLAAVCSSRVGAVLAFEASRLARNNRDWHHLIDLCAMAGTLVVDHDGIYDPSLLNDRLLLGLKGTMSEFEISLLRQRAMEARRQKVGRRSSTGLNASNRCASRGRVSAIGLTTGRDDFMRSTPSRRNSKCRRRFRRRIDESDTATCELRYRCK